jgi:hypothetical protein
MLTSTNYDDDVEKYKYQRWRIGSGSSKSSGSDARNESVRGDDDGSGRQVHGRTH